MAKKYIIYASGKDLATVGVTQNESGKYYRNSAGTYYKPILAEFDTATLPSGYKTYIGGSHAKYVSNPNRNPIDLSLVAGTVLTMNVDVKILASTLSDGSWVKVGIVGTDIILAFVHTYRWANTSTIVKAGNQIAQIAPQSVTGFAPHLHMDDWSGKGRKVRQLILNGDYDMSTFKIGDKIEITGVQNIRKGSGTSYEVTRETKVGEIYTIEGGFREADGYTWWDLKESDWIADVGKFKTYTPPAPAPVDPCEELKKRIDDLLIEIKGLKEAVGALESKLKLSEERVAYLEQDRKTWEGEIEKLEKEVLDARDLAKRFEVQYIEVVTELNELKAGRDNWLNRLADMLHKLFSGSK